MTHDPRGEGKITQGARGSTSLQEQRGAWGDGGAGREGGAKVRE